MRNVLRRLTFQTVVWIVTIALSAPVSENVPHSVRAASTLQVKQRPATVDDILRQEDYGQALIDPTGQRLVFQKTPPYEQLPDYSVPWSSRYLETNFGQIMVVDLTSPTNSRLLFEPEAQAQYRIQSFSPDGRRLAFYAVKEGKVRLMICDVATRQLKTFKETPRLTFYDTTVLWVSNEELVYGALTGDRQSILSYRHYTGSRLFEAWNKTWKGKDPSVNEVASYADGGGRNFRDGMLVKANVRTGNSDFLDRGLFTDLKVSSSGRFIAAVRQSDEVQPLPDRTRTSELRTRFQLVVIDLRARESRVVAPNMAISPGSMVWSPVDDLLAYFGWETAANIQAGLFYSYNARSGHSKAWPHSGLDLATGGYPQIAGQKPQPPAWLNGRLAVVARSNPKGDETARFTDRGMAGRWNDSSLGKADWYLIASGGSSENLTSNFSAVSPVAISVTAKGICLLADGNVWRISSDGTKSSLTGTAGNNLERTRYLGEAQLRYSENVALVAHEAGAARYLFVDLSNDARMTTVVAPSLRATLLTSSVRAGVALFREETGEGPRLLLRRTDGTTSEVDRLQQNRVGIEMPAWKLISYRISADRELQSGVLLPYGYTPKRRYPVVVEIYPSMTFGPSLPNGIDRVGSFYYPHLLAGKEYIVLYVTNPPDLNRTKEGPIKGMAKVVLQGIDALVAQGYADPNRICLIGYSQGGFSSLWLATETDRFKAIVSINGWADLASHYFEGGIFREFYFEDLPFAGESLRYDRAEGSDFGIGRTPWQNPEIYIHNSPVYRADRIKTPIMLVHSDMDGFSVSQYEMMFTALYRLRKEARLVRYWGEGHGPSSPANIRDLWYRTFAWFDEWSDISRDQQGNLVWDGDNVKSLNVSPPLKPENFARFDQMILKNTKR